MKKLVLGIVMLLFAVGIHAEVNLKYSYKDFTGQDLSDRKDMTGEIIGSCFWQENAPDSEVLPSDCDATFIRCNLDNVLVPVTATVQGGTNKRIKIIDNEQWIVDKDLKKLESMELPEDEKASWVDTGKRVYEIEGEEWVVSDGDEKLQKLGAVIR